MKKTLRLFAALAVMFLMSADVYSSDDGTISRNGVSLHCVQKPDYSSCEKKLEGIYCYLIDEDCNYIDDQTPPEE